MKEKELRIGNYIKFISTGNIERVHNIVSDFRWQGKSKREKYLDSANINDVDIKDVQSIPLTEEILLKCGFKKRRIDSAVWYTKSCGKNKPELMTNDIGEDAFSTKLKFVFIDTYDNIKIKHLHRLQNLYFAITNKELNITL